MSWQKRVERRGESLLLKSLIWQSQTVENFKRILNIPFGTNKGFSVVGEIFTDEDEFDALKNGVRILGEKNGLDWLASRISILEKNGNALLDYAWRVNETDFRGSSRDALKSAFAGFVERFFDFGPSIWYPLAAEGFLQEALLDKIKRELLKKRKASKISDVLLVLSKPMQRTESDKELVDFYLIASEIQEAGVAASFYKKGFRGILQDPVIIRRIKKHSQDYGWIGVRWGTGREWSPDDIAARLRLVVTKEDCIKKYLELVGNRKRIGDETVRLFSELGFSSRDTQVSRLAKRFGYLRTYRSDTMGKSLWLIKPLLREIGKKSGLSYENMAFLSFREILSLLEGGVMDRKKVLERRKAFAYLFEDGGEKIFSGRALEEARRMVFQPLEENDVTGFPASPGTARGTVRVVLDPAFYKGFKEGDILVAPMTNPNFVPLMQKASAIITDEGGILCHAAIVSRELGKPCIIGTKYATRILKDGEEIFVNATAGTVKRYSHR